MPKIVRLENNKEEGLVVYIQKKVLRTNYIATKRIKCDGWPTLIEGIRKYTEGNLEKWNLAEEERVGFLLKGRTGYNTDGMTLKTVDFYRVP